MAALFAALCGAQVANDVGLAANPQPRPAISVLAVWSAWPVVFGFDLVAAFTLALATMAMGVMDGFALVFVPPWIAFRRARSWRGGLVLAALIGLGGYIAAFLLALGLDQPFGPVLALLLIAVGLIIA